MRDFSKVFAVIAVAAVIFLSATWHEPAEADYQGSSRFVKTNWCSQSGAYITTAAPVSMVVGANAVETDPVRLTRSSEHAIGFSLDAGGATPSCVIRILGSFDKTNFTTYPTDITFTATAEGHQIVPISLPVTPWIKVQMAPDASATVEFDNVVVLSW